MAQNGITDFIRNTIEEIPAYQLFTSKDLILIAADKFGIEKEKMMYSINVILNMSTGKDILRYQKGVYYRPDKNILGPVPLSRGEQIYSEYVENNIGKIGYLTGPSLYLKLGLSTQVPKDTYYASNNVKKREKILKEVNIVIRPTKTAIDNNNYRYFQILDLIENKDNIFIETDLADKVVWEFLEANCLQYHILIGYAGRYYSKRVVDELVNIAKRKIY